MSKYSRNIDEKRMNKSKAKTIDFVMNEIDFSAKKRFVLSFRTLALVMSVLVIAIVTSIVLDPFSSTPSQEPIVLTTFETEKLAELSYISGRLIASTFVLDNPSINLQLSNPIAQSSIMFLSDDEETELETNIDEFNIYFDMLKVFLDTDTFSNAVTVTPITEGEYDTSIEFFVDGKRYTFLVIVIENDITGELTINDQVFDVVGTYEETDVELSMEITASSGSNYINIKYKTENEDELEKKYEIEQFIDGILRTKEIKVSIEEGEEKVEINENEDTYELEKEIEDSGVVYKLTYKIDGVEGEAEICESINDLGETIYSYRISEGDKVKELDLDDPDEHDEEDEEEHENEDEEDEEDEENQSNQYYEQKTLNIL